MLNNKTVAVVVPSFNEELQIGLVIRTMPEFVDRIVIVNDCSSDGTEKVVTSFFGSPFDESGVLTETKKEPPEGNLYNRADRIIWERNIEEIRYFPPSDVLNENSHKNRIILINLKKNSGVGGAIARGYKWCKDMNIDCTAVMAGDGQMDPGELESICRPVVEESIDYVKGNRLIHSSATELIPKKRLFGNSVLSILTKIASGYWSVSDTQTGFTAISARALNAIKLYQIYPRYGMPNDLLVKLNIAYCTLRELEIKPVYNIGEKSKMKIGKILRPIIWLLIKSFFQRIWKKYLFRDFHPLFILYHLAIILLMISVPYGIKIIVHTFRGIDANPVTVLAFMFLFLFGFQSLLFAMWMDIQDNERLFK